MRKVFLLGLIFAGALLASVFGQSAQAPQPNSSDPKFQSTGEQDRAYTFPGTGESIAYHVYVPMKWDKNTKLPLVIVTHGANQPSTAPFMRPMANPTLARTAEQRGYIVAAVTGYHANATGVGGWNVPFAMAQVAAAGRGGGAAGGGARGGAAGGAARGGAGAQPAATPEDFQRVEQDVLYVTDLMTREYNVDPNRIYLMGNSSGGSAVWQYGQKYPERWTAISPSAAPLVDTDFPYERLKNVPVLVVHGDMDTTMVYDGSKAMVDHAKAKGVNATFLGVAGGMHTDAWAQPEIISQVFDFFDKYRTRQK